MSEIDDILKQLEGYPARVVAEAAGLSKQTVHFARRRVHAPRYDTRRKLRMAAIKLELERDAPADSARR